MFFLCKINFFLQPLQDTCGAASIHLINFFHTCFLEFFMANMHSHTTMYFYLWVTQTWWHSMNVSNIYCELSLASIWRTRRLNSNVHGFVLRCYQYHWLGLGGRCTEIKYQKHAYVLYEAWHSKCQWAMNYKRMRLDLKKIKEEAPVEK